MTGLSSLTAKVTAAFGLSQSLKMMVLSVRTNQYPEKNKS
jgi:hypothetical protein